MPRTGQPAIRHIASVQRAVAVLDALADEEPALGTNEIARRTGINPSTVSRLLATLAEAGLVEHDASNGRYRLGLRLLHLGNSVLARVDLRAIARPMPWPAPVTRTTFPSIDTIWLLPLPTRDIHRSRPARHRPAQLRGRS